MKTGSGVHGTRAAGIQKHRCSKLVSGWRLQKGEVQLVLEEENVAWCALMTPMRMALDGPRRINASGQALQSESGPKLSPLASIIPQKMVRIVTVL